MTEPTKTRFTIDLEEIDRQLRRAAPAPLETPAARREPVIEPASKAAFEKRSADEVSGYAPMPLLPPMSPLPPRTPMLTQPPVQAHAGDPLRELARIIGQDDPFDSILGNPAAGTPVAPQPLTPKPAESLSLGGSDFRAHQPAPAMPNAAGLPEVGSLADYLRSESPRPGTPAAPSQAPLNRQVLPSSLDFGALEGLAAKASGSAVGSHAAAAPSPVPVKAGAFEAPGYAPKPLSSWQTEAVAPLAPKSDFENYTPSYANPSLGYQPGYQPEAESEQEFAEPPRSKKWLWRGVMALVLLGGATGGYGYMRSKGIVGGGEPPVVVATSGPTKVAPTVPDGKEFPDQNKQIYQNGAKEVRTQIVNREEQPVDVRQATGAVNSPLTDANSLGAARKVRTIVVASDGQVLGDDGAPPASASPSSQQRPQPQPQKPLPYVPVRGAGSSAPVMPSPAPAPVQQAAAPTAVTPPPTPAPVPTPTPSRPQAVQPSAPQAATPAPAPQRVAATLPPVERPAAPVERAATSGPYTIQFGIAKSDADGRAQFARIKAQHSKILNGVSAAIQSATVNGATIYRIRSSGVSKATGDALCRDLVAAGGSCFVAKN